MKHIDKADEPAPFADWKRQNIPLGMGYGELHGDVKNGLHAALMREQGWICCYCERRITQADSHIEHFCPQRGDDACPKQDLDYRNLLCSCQLPHAPVPKEPRHCGVLKGQWFSSALISPMDVDCEGRFRFAADGSVYPADNDRDAKMTIERLGLDIDKLRKLRASALQALEDLPGNKVQKLLEHPDNGKLQPFYTTIRQLLA
ncbi:MAG: TIGR02646 family protein [Magnetococcus sp. MYC-9]